MRLSVLQRTLKSWGKVVGVAVMAWLPTSGWATVTVDSTIAGPGSAPQITTLAIDPNNPGVMYAGSYLAQSAIYKTTNRGTNWAPLPIGGAAAAIAVAPSDSNTVYVAIASTMGTLITGEFVAREPTLYKSVDGGAHWQTISQQVQTTIDVNSLVVDPFNANTLYVSGDVSAEGNNLVLKSVDSGASWAIVASACVPTGGGGGGGSSGGASTIDCTGRLTATFSAFALDPSNPSVMYVASYYGSIYRSTDAGQTWTLLGSTTSLTGVASMAVDPSDTDKLYVTTDSGIVKVSVSQDAVTMAFPSASTDLTAMLFFTNEATAQLYQVQPQQPQLHSLGGGAMQHFAFNEQRAAALNVQVTSNEVTITGTSGGAQAVTIVGGEYSINNGVFTDATGVINAGDKIKVRLTTPFSLNTAISATVNIGGTVGYFTVTTRESNPFPPEIYNWPFSRSLFGPVAEGFSGFSSFQMTDRDGDVPRCSSTTLPEGATLRSDASGQCVFSWATKRGDAGNYVVTIKLSDGVATTAYDVTVQITPAVPALYAALDEGTGTQTSAIFTDPWVQDPYYERGHLRNSDWIKGVAGHAIHFSGHGSARFFPIPHSLPTRTITVEAWIKPTLANQTSFAVSQEVDYLTPLRGLAYALGLSKGKLQGVLQDEVHVSDATVPTGVWSHLALTWDELTVVLYLNGTQVYQAPNTFPLAPFLSPVDLGQRGARGDYMVGAIDEVKLWRIARLPDELCAEAGRFWNGSSCTGSAFGNVAPVATKDSFTVGANDVTLGQLTATDSNGDALTYAVVRAPARGTVVIEDANTGRFSYRAGNFPGQTDSFTFVAIDKFARSKAATVSIQIGVSSSNDHDGDGMPDAFEVARGLNPASTIDGAQDADKDGTSNYYEFIAATDPTIGEESTPEHVLGMSFSEGFGAVTTIDSTSYHHIGSITGATWIGARRGYGLRFGGTNMVAVADSAALDVTSGITIEMWIRPTATAQNTFVAAKNVDTNTAFAYGLGLANGALRAQFGSTRYTSTFVVPVNVWTHVAVTWDGAAVHLYANGQEVFVSPRSTSLLTNNAPLLIGARSKVGGIAQGFRGDIDQVNVWRIGRSADQICRAAGGVYDGAACTL